MASSPITSWQIDGETMETVRYFIFLGSKITADGDCSHEIKRHMLLGRKSYDQPRQHIKKQRHCFANRGHLIKAMVFPVVMYGCKSWTIKKAEHRRIDAFEVWCWNRLLRVPWTARRSNQVHPKENQSWIFIGKTDAEAETLVLWPLIWRTDSLEKTCWERLKARGEGNDRGWDGWMASLTRWKWVWASLGSWWWIGKVGMLQSIRLQRVGRDWATELNSTENTLWYTVMRILLGAKPEERKQGGDQ